MPPSTQQFGWRALEIGRFSEIVGGSKAVQGSCLPKDARGSTKIWSAIEVDMDRGLPLDPAEDQRPASQVEAGDETFFDLADLDVGGRSVSGFEDHHIAVIDDDDCAFNCVHDCI